MIFGWYFHLELSQKTIISTFFLQYWKSINYLKMGMIVVRCMIGVKSHQVRQKMKGVCLNHGHDAMIRSYVLTHCYGDIGISVNILLNLLNHNH